MIDEKELLKTLNNAGTNITFDIPVEEILDNDVNLDGFVALIQDAVMACKKMVIDTIESMPKVGEWIPAAKQKPRELIDVLVTVQDIQNGDSMLVMIGNYKDWWQVYDIDGTEQSKARVFAWMPLPEAYGEESAE